jgi:hypothetical protein
VFVIESDALTTLHYPPGSMIAWAAPEKSKVKKKPVDGDVEAQRELTEADLAAKREQRRKKLVKFLVFTAITVFVTFLASVVMAILNLSLLHTAMREVAGLPDSQFLRVMEDACIAVGAPGFYYVVVLIQSVVSAIGNFARLGAEWNCGGALSMVSPFILFFFVLFLLVLLQKDWLLALAITFQASAKRHPALRSSSRLISFVLSMVVLYTLQIIIVSLTDVVAIAWQIQRSCSRFDRAMIDAWDGLLVFFLFIFFYIAVLLFGTVKSVDLRGFTVEWLKGLWSITKISFGLWDQAGFDGFHIEDRAERFDNDDEDDNSHHETVMALTAQARGLMFVPIPYGIILTKCAHFLSDPPVLIWKSKEIDGLDLFTPYKKRVVLFSFNLLILIVMINTVFIANTSAVIALVVLIGLASIGKGITEVYLFCTQLGNE